MAKDEYIKKLEIAFKSELSNIENPQILEFGVRHGQSTELFLEICEKKKGFLYSVDVDDYTDKFQSTKWKFIHGRDDDYELIEKFIPQKLDLIYLDSFHNAKHVEKIIYHYYDFLKPNCLYIIDDISWIPYSKENKRDNFNSEINNYETFNKILDIFNNNQDKMEISFSFIGSGLAIIKKLNDKKLNNSKKIILRKNTLKNIARKILRK